MSQQIIFFKDVFNCNKEVDFCNQEKSNNADIMSDMFSLQNLLTQV